MHYAPNRGRRQPLASTKTSGKLNGIDREVTALGSITSGREGIQWTREIAAACFASKRPCYIALTMFSVIFLASPSSIMVLSR
jgi:hypothetical protein